MKILYIWHAAVEPGFRKLLDKMSQLNGISLTLVTTHKWKESGREQKWDKTINLPYKAYGLFVVFPNHIRSFFFLNIFKIIFILLRTKPDIIYLKEEPYSIAAFQWVVLSHIFSRESKIIIESDENLIFTQPFPYSWIEKFVLNSIDSIACVPTDGIKLYRTKGFKGQIYKTSYFIDEEVFHSIDKEKASLHFPEINTSMPSIGYVGRITEEKGIDTLIEATKILISKGYKFNVYLLGSVNPEFKTKLESFLSDPLVKEHLHLLKARPMEKLVFFYNLMDAIVLPSKTTSWWKEQFGRVIIESQACGTPVIGSSSGEIPYVIGDSFFVFEEGNPLALATIMEKIVSGQISKSQASEKVKTLALSRFSLSNVIKQKLEIMENVAKFRNEGKI